MIYVLLFLFHVTTSVLMFVGLTFCYPRLRDGDPAFTIPLLIYNEN